MFRILRSLAGALAAFLAFAAQAAPISPKQIAAPLSPDERAAMVAALRADCDPAAAEAPRLGDEDLLRAVTVMADVDLAQRIRPSNIDHVWAYEPPRHDTAAELQAARAAGRLGAWLASLSSPEPRYRALLKARCRYQAITAAGGWAPLPKTLRLSVGDERPEVRTLRQRLAAEGYLAPSATASAVFDETVQRALRAFQERHAIAADGLVNAKTLAALNVTAEDRLAQIEANLERWRWLPRPLPANRLEVDVGAAQAALYRDGTSVLAMRVIVGDPRHRSPLFTTPRLQSIVFNPPWNVPDSIAKSEILPKAARNPGYLAREGISYVNGRLQQHPGPKNSLGQLKIDFPSPFGVYLHDTPAKSLFARPVRVLSHGCMRMEKPREIAAVLLANQGWTADRVDAAIAAGATQRVDLRGAPPLFVIYTTVDVAADGAVTFRPDPYGWDDKLADALSAIPVGETRPRPFVVRPPAKPDEFGP